MKTLIIYPNEKNISFKITLDVLFDSGDIYQQKEYNLECIIPQSIPRRINNSVVFNGVVFRFDLIKTDHLYYKLCFTCNFTKIQNVFISVYDNIKKCIIIKKYFCNNDDDLPVNLVSIDLIENNNVLKIDIDNNNEEMIYYGRIKKWPGLIVLKQLDSKKRYENSRVSFFGTDIFLSHKII